MNLFVLIAVAAPLRTHGARASTIAPRFWQSSVMRGLRSTATLPLFFVGVLLSFAVTLLPDVAHAHSEPMHLAESVEPPNARTAETAVDRHCNPGFDCQFAAIFVHNPTVRPAVAISVHRFPKRWIELQSRIVPFDLPPPRHRF